MVLELPVMNFLKKKELIPKYIQYQTPLQLIFSNKKYERYSIKYIDSLHTIPI
jgi:hypothetical protein